MNNFLQEYKESFKLKPNIFVEKMKDALYDGTSEDLVELISLTALMSFCSHARVHGESPEKKGGKITANIFTFLLSGSGSGKDKTTGLAHSMLDSWYNTMHAENKIALEDMITKQLMEKFGDNVVQNPDFDEMLEKAVNKVKMPNFFIEAGSANGFIYHLHNLKKYPYGAAWIAETELGSALATANEFATLMPVLAKAFDVGTIPEKAYKTLEAQIPEIKNMPITMLAFADKAGIIWNQNAKKKFVEEMQSRYARRAIFADIPDVARVTEAKTIEEFEEEIFKRTKRKNAAIDWLDLNEPNIKNNEIKLYDAWISKEALLEYYGELSAEVDKTNPLYKKHLSEVHWRALKIAIGFAFLHQETEVTRERFEEGLYYSEKYSKSLKDFEDLLNKETYEYFMLRVEELWDGETLNFKLDKLIKEGFITSAGAKTRLKELFHLIQSVNSPFIFQLENNDSEITAVKVVSDKNELGMSYRMLPEGISKDEKAKMANDGYTYKVTTFEKLANLLSKETSYCPFEFIGGIRKDENIVNESTKVVVLDVDNGEMTYQEAHDILQDFNHHIACTSKGESSPYHYRIIMELDNAVEISRSDWKRFMTAVTEYLGINKFDNLPRSQIYFGFAGREVLSITDADKLPALELISLMKEKPEPKNHGTKSAKWKREALENDLDTFHYAWNKKPEISRNLTLYKVMKHCRNELEAEYQYTLNLINEINDYWSPNSLTETQMEKLEHQLGQIYELH